MRGYVRAPQLSQGVRQTAGKVTAMILVAQRQNMILLGTLVVVVLTASCATAHHTQSSGSSSGASSDDVVTITNSCGVMDPVRFVGHVVHRVADGTLKPLADVTIIRSRDTGFLTAGFQVQKYRVTRDGRFEIPIVRGVESTKVADGQQMRESETIEEVTFTFEAPGCDAVQWHPALDERPVTIEMKCPSTSNGASSG